MIQNSSDRQRLQREVYYFFPWHNSPQLFLDQLNLSDDRKLVSREVRKLLFSIVKRQLQYSEFGALRT